MDRPLDEVPLEGRPPTDTRVIGFEGGSESIVEVEQPLRRWYFAYGLTVLLIVVATLAHRWLSVFGRLPPYITYYPAIILVSLAAGQGPALWATLLSVAFADYFFLVPIGSFAIHATGDAISLVLFLLSGVAISLIAGELQTREEELKAAFESSPAAMALVDANLVFRRVNRAMAALHNRNVNEYKGKTIWQLVPKIAPTFEPVIKQVIRSGRAVIGVQLTARSEVDLETVRHWQASYYPVRVRGGRALEVGAVVFETTQIKRLEEALRHSETHLKDAQQLAEIGSWRWNPMSGVVTWSDELFRIAGLPPAPRALDFSEQAKLFSAESWIRLTAVVDHALKTGQAYEVELQLLRPDGASRWVVGRGKPELNAGGETVLLQGTLQDITERKRSDEMRILLAEREQLVLDLRRSLDEKQALLAEVHHRVKNNLQIVSSLLSIQAAAIDDPQARAKLAESQLRVRSMATIHEHLYRQGDMTSIDLADYVTSLASEIFASYNERRSITYHLQVVPLKVTLAQAVPCGLILNELITNALKYAYPSGTGEISIRLLRDGPDNSLAIVDRGIGLPAGFDVAHCKSLGLKIIHALTSQLRGTLEIGTGQETSFLVRFPNLIG